MALLARQPDAIDARQPLAVANVADQPVDRLLEVGRLTKCLEIDHQYRLPGIGGRRVILVEIDHIAPHRRAIQGTGQQAHHQRQPISLMTADRQQKTFMRTGRIQ